MLTIDRIVSLIDSPSPVIVEIGANNGHNSYEFLSAFDGCSVYAFEPDPRAVRKLQERNFDRRFKLVEKAVGRTSGKIKFFQSSGAPPGETWPDGWDMSGSLKRPKEHLQIYPWCTFDSEIEVEVIDLDTWAATEKVSAIDFIWADVQGAEEDLIIGAQRILNSTRYFYTEYSERELYEGSIGVKRILQLMPCFSVVEQFENDVLLINNRINKT